MLLSRKYNDETFLVGMITKTNYLYVWNKYEIHGVPDAIIVPVGLRTVPVVVRYAVTSETFKLNNVELTADVKVLVLTKMEELVSLNKNVTTVPVALFRTRNLLLIPGFVRHEE